MILFVGLHCLWSVIYGKHKSDVNFILVWSYTLLISPTFEKKIEQGIWKHENCVVIQGGNICSWIMSSLSMLCWLWHECYLCLSVLRNDANNTFIHSCLAVNKGMFFASFVNVKVFLLHAALLKWLFLVVVTFLYKFLKL